jgi:tetratricopeptide (TPR) repeat protein
MSLARTLAWINIRVGWRALFWAAVLLLLAALLDLVPLFNVLGYDSAFAIGLATALAGVDIGHGAVNAARRQGRSVSPPRLAGEAIVATWAILAVPLLLSLGNAWRVRNCKLGAGLAFFALLPVCTGAFAAGTGAALASAIPGPRAGRLAAFALPLLSVGWTLARLYRDPAVFAFDPFAGFFPGPIYDEALRPSLRLVWYRLANLTWLAAAMAVAHCLCRPSSRGLRLALRPLGNLVRPWPRVLVALALMAASFGWFEARGTLGFHVRHADLARILPRETRSPHFILRTDPAAESDADIALAQQDLEFRYQQLVRILGVEPALPVTVYRFPSSAAKKDTVGAANTLYAKPWTREIFVQADHFPAQRLRHELAHIFASAFGDRLFGVSLAWHFVGPLPWPTLASGLVEGMAEAADFDNPDGRATTHQEAAAMFALGKAPDLRRALGAGFTFESGPRAYTLVGSFCRFLLDAFGADKLRALYRSAGDFARVYGRDLASLEKDWRAFLSALPPDDSSRAQAEENFRRPAIFQKVCARELAARVSEARARLGTAPGEAVSLLSSACADDPSEPTFRLDLAEALVAAGESDRALAILAEAAASGTLTRPLRGRAASLEAGIHFRARRYAEAQAALEQALRTSTEDSDERFAKARLRALRDNRAAETLGRVLFGDERGRPLDAALALYLLTQFEGEARGDALGPYLVGRQLAVRDPKLAVDHLESACPFAERPKENPVEAIIPRECRPWIIAPREETRLDSTFFKECRRLLGESAYLAGDLSTARAAYTWLSEHAEGTADRLRAQDFLQRIAWKNSH